MSVPGRRLLAGVRRVLAAPITSGARRAVLTLFVVTLALAGANLLFTAHEANSVRHQFAAAAAQATRQGQIVERKLCVSFGRLASLRPPPGNPADNPSRAYLQEQHTILDEIGADIHCGGTR